MTWPTIFDLGTEDDAGSWLEALAFARFPVLDFESVEEVARRLPKADGFRASDRPFNHPREIDRA